MQISLKGQAALVTGASSGIGEAVAVALGAAGADVVVNYVSSPETAEAVADKIRAGGSRAIAIKADVSKEDEVQGMFAQMLAEFGTIDILVNNAGLQKDAPFHEMTIEQWNKVIDVNLTGQFLCAREAIREFLRRGVVEETSVAAGKIICMSSVHELIPLGRPCELRRFQRRDQDADAESGTGIRRAEDPCQQHLPRCHSNQDQHSGMEHAGSTLGAYDPDPIQPYWSTTGYRQSRRVPGL
jgi:NAD(P)-dependent dehydrogenase (short-subunit alcohol dehydrogenase family)